MQVAMSILRSSGAFLVIINLSVALTVDSQGCINNAGSLNHNNLRVVPDRTFIFSDSGYTVVCEGTVIAWEFCYKEENKTSMTFYPGIWMPPKANNSSTNEYTLVKSSTITFTPTRSRVDNDDDNDKISCQTYNLTEADQFIAPAGSIVGLYSNMRGMQPSLLRTNSMAQLLTTYQFLGNRSNVSISISNNISYNIALRVHLDNLLSAQCAAPMNGNFHCPNGNRNPCTFSCNAGYELQGSHNGTCLANQSWSEGDPICVALNCSTSQPLNNSQLLSSCDSQYQSTCATVCVDGYTGVGGSYTCVVTDEDTNSVGWNGSASCQRVPCISPSDPKNGNVTCPSNTSVFQDTCTYHCNRGYQLEGNRQTRCDTDGTWSSEPVTCTILKCNDPEVEIANSQSVGACNVTYGSSCLLNCTSGFSNEEHVCDDVNDEGTSVKWRSLRGAFNCEATGTSTATEDNSSSASDIPIIFGSLGGATLVVLVSLCVVILWALTSHKRRSCMFCNRGVIKVKLSSDIKMTRNPSYNNVPKQNRRQEDQLYEYVSRSKFSIQHCSRTGSTDMDSNISNGREQDSNTITNNANDYRLSNVYDVATPPNSLSCSLDLVEIEIRSKNGDDSENSYIEPNSPDHHDIYTQRTADYLKIIGSVPQMMKN